MDFKEVSFKRFCPTISWSFFSSETEGSKKKIEILRIMFHGIYREGIEGDDDSHLISVIVSAAVHFWVPKYVIIDLSDLDYKSGDEFEKIYDSVDDDDIQTVVLVGEKCRKAMTHLYFGTEAGKDIVDKNFFFDDLDEAISKLRKQDNFTS